MLKLAVIKIGSRITYSGRTTSGGDGEARSIINMLLETGKTKIDIYTKILKNDVNDVHENLTFYDIIDEYQNVNSRGYDALLVINGSPNFFGGADFPELTLNFVILNNFKGKPFYIHCDPALELKQIWSLIEKKPWSSNYKKEDIEIKRSDITIIAQSYNTDYLKSIYEKRGLPIKDIYNYPFDKFPMLNERMPFNDSPSWHISYGGTLRTGKREDKLIEFYFGYPDDFLVEVFGKIEYDKFTPKKIDGLRPPIFSKPVKYDEMLQKMNDCVAHVVIGDKAYAKYDIMSQRSYEAILSNAITFIDSSLDVNKRMFGHNKELASFLYVDNRNQVYDRVKMIDKDNEMRLALSNEQFNALNFNKEEYCEGFYNLIKKHI